MEGSIPHDIWYVNQKMKRFDDFLLRSRYNARMSQNFADASHAGIRFIGFSLAGEETFIAAPELNVCFDIGRAPREVIAIDHILLSHGHMDHAAGVAYYFAQRTFVDNAPGNLFVPANLVDPIQLLLETWADIDGQQPRAIVRPAVPGEVIDLRRDLAIRPFKVNHSTRRRDRAVVDALGYTVLDVRKKLKPEFEGMDGPQLVEQKKKGVEITRRVEMPLVSYCGDTAPGDFFDLDHVRNAKVLLLECTFVEPDHLARARAGRHIHVSYLKDILPRLRNEKIVLTHLSRRTALHEAKKALEREIGPSEMERVAFLMDTRRR